MSIEVCSDGSGYVIACKDKYSGMIKLVKVDVNGIEVPTGNFNYTPVMNFALIPYGRKSLGLKQLNNGNFLLGGAFNNPTELSRDLFMQDVNSFGSGETPIQFAIPGIDCRC